MKKTLKFLAIILALSLAYSCGEKEPQPQDPPQQEQPDDPVNPDPENPEDPENPGEPGDEQNPADPNNYQVRTAQDLVNLATLVNEGTEVKSERIRVLLPEGVYVEAVAAEKALHTDITEPTKRLILIDTSHKSRLYLTVFTKRDDVTDPKIQRASDGVRISYKQGEDTVNLLWSFSNSLKRV